MGILKIQYSFLLVYLFLPILISTAATNCTSTCGDHTIRSPFRLRETPSTCGYPTFNLICKPHLNQTVTSLPGSGGDFLVRRINYTAQTIQVYDPGNCLPRRLIRFNLSGSPFMADFSANYTLFSCPKQFQGLGFPIIPCLGNSTTSVLAILNGTFAGAMVARSCHKMYSLMVPGRYSTRFLKGDDVLELRWAAPHCQNCQVSDDSTEKSTNDRTFKIIALSIIIPIMSCSVAIWIFLCILDGRNSPDRSHQAAGGPQRAPTEGLDQATIDSYTTVVLGESTRVAGPNKDTCLVCLSDYIPKETLRYIPQCQHCFHLDCIDEWLRIKGSCPICRKSPLVH